MILAPATAAAVAEFSARVRARFGARVDRLVLFGSHARGETTEESDIDLLVVIDDLMSHDARDVDEIVGDMLTRTNVLLSPLVLSAERLDQLRARERRLVAEIDRDGIPV
jgi:hypothetical protein